MTVGLDLKKPTYAPAYMVGIYPALAEIARGLGYALALHGSLQRDLDLIAVPWTDEAADPVDLVKSLCDEFDVAPNHPMDKPEQKPHGRLGWSVPLWWGAYLDISVMPRAIDYAKRQCIAEWSNVNDPPCHPSDKEWLPCASCMPSLRKEQT